MNYLDKLKALGLGLRSSAAQRTLKGRGLKAEKGHLSGGPASFPSQAAAAVWPVWRDEF